MSRVACRVQNNATGIALAHTGKGTAMQAHRAMVRFVRPGAGGRMIEFDVVEVRRLLRTNMSIPQIAAQLGQEPHNLQSFIRRRNLCNLTERRRFIELQESLRKDEMKPASMQRFRP